MSFSHWLVLLSALISVVGACAYIRDTLKGTTTPNRVSWSMWALAPLIGTAAAAGAGADAWALVRTFLAGFLPLLVFVASFFNRHGYWRLSRFDLLCGALSCVALVVWLAIDAPRVAIVLAASGDGFASIPTIVKAWRFPETETASTYLASFVSVLLVLPSLPDWSVENSAFQVYLLIVNSILLCAVYRKRLLKAVSTAQDS